MVPKTYKTTDHFLLDIRSQFVPQIELKFRLKKSIHGYQRSADLPNETKRKKKEDIKWIHNFWLNVNSLFNDKKRM